MSDAPATITPVSVRVFRIVAFAEAVSWLALIVATIVKYTAGNAGAVHVLGPVHGALFVVYILLVLEVRTRLHWDARTTLVVLLDSVLPGGGFLVARRGDLS